MTNETEAWARLDRISEAEAVQERVVAEYGEEAVAVFAETATRFEHATDTYERVQFASARFKQGFFLMQLDRGDEADAVFADLITRFQEEDSPPFEQLVAAAHEIRHQLADPDDE
jgi:hypothetical protein